MFNMFEYLWFKLESVEFFAASSNLLIVGEGYLYDSQCNE